MSITDFENVSIRARFAFSMLCFENSLPMEINTRPVLLQKAIDKAWEFTNSPTVDDWREEMLEFDPQVLEEAYPNFNDGKLVSAKEAKELFEIYKSLPLICVELFKRSFWLGESGIYTNFASANKSTLSVLEGTLQILDDSFLPVRELDKIMQSRPEGLGNWGEAPPKDWWVG